MTEASDFGRLTDVEPRQAWAHEAHNFTPWLADNLDRLSDAIGIPLELSGREVGVGRYSADILAKNPQDGGMVLIENQLQWSDHTHLGQILTYMAGLEAETVVWLAPQFREEHLSALRWLNQHTSERFAFFAIRLRVVQIGDSLLAPLFDVLEKPNAWERSLQKTVREVTEPLQDNAWRQLFWQRCLVLFPESAADRGGGGRGSSRWRSIEGSNFVISRWVSEGKAGVFVRGERGTHTPDVFQDLREDAEALERTLGAALGASPWYPFLKEISYDAESAEDVDRAIRWLESETQRYAKAIKTYSEGK